MIDYRKDWLLWLVIAALFVAAIIIYPHLPEQVPGHWNLEGEVDRYVSKEFGAFLGPVLALAVYLLLVVTPRVDPKGGNFPKYGRAWHVFRWLMVLFFGVLSGVTWATALGYQIKIGKVVGSLVALLFIVLGNYLPKIQYKNYTFGIRTPWTLDNEEVWRKTHRWTGKFLVTGGLVGLVAVLLNEKVGFFVLLAGILIPLLGSLVYSYLTYQRLKS
ncbi:MAG: SdpI family protein [Firmicutes bacterium]|nr:SdpI family protein [Bacillota bacterium]